MTERVLTVLLLATAAVYGWIVVGDYRDGKAALPRTGWVVERRYDPALFWAFTGVHALMLAIMFSGIVAMALR